MSHTKQTPPSVIQWIHRLNALAIIYSGLSLYFIATNEQQTLHFFFIYTLMTSGLIFFHLIFTLRLKSGLGFCHVLLYALALMQGLKIFLSVSSLATLSGFVSSLLSAILIFYLLGLKGFLKSKHGLTYFRVNESLAECNE